MIHSADIELLVMTWINWILKRLIWEYFLFRRIILLHIWYNCSVCGIVYNDSSAANLSNFPIFSRLFQYQKPDWPEVLKKSSDDIRTNFPIPFSKFKFWWKTIASDLRRSWKGDDNRTTVPCWFPTISHRSIQQLGHWLNVMNIWYVQTITWPNLIMGLERPFETEFSPFVILQAVNYIEIILNTWLNSGKFQKFLFWSQNCHF